jgi:hypothetical protein
MLLNRLNFRVKIFGKDKIPLVELNIVLMDYNNGYTQKSN